MCSMTCKHCRYMVAHQCQRAVARTEHANLLPSPGIMSVDIRILKRVFEMPASIAARACGGRIDLQLSRPFNCKTETRR